MGHVGSSAHLTATGTRAGKFTILSDQIICWQIFTQNLVKGILQLGRLAYLLSKCILLTSPQIIFRLTEGWFTLSLINLRKVSKALWRRRSQEVEKKSFSEIEKSQHATHLRSNWPAMTYQGHMGHWQDLRIFLRQDELTKL